MAFSYFIISASACSNHVVHVNRRLHTNCLLAHMCIKPEQMSATGLELARRTFMIFVLPISSQRSLLNLACRFGA